MANTIVACGPIGNKRCFLNKTVEEAIVEYRQERLDATGIEMSDLDIKRDMVIFEFDDRFDAYDVQGNQASGVAPLVYHEPQEKFVPMY